MTELTVTITIAAREYDAVAREVRYHEDDPACDKRGLELARNDHALTLDVLRKIVSAVQPTG